MPHEPVVIVCTGCGQKIRVPPKHFRDAGRCPRCKTSFEPVQPGAAPGKPRSSWSRRIWVFAWAYLALVVLAAGLMWGVDETWVVSSLLLFSPRWWWALPLLALVPGATLTRPAALAPLGCASVIGLWLISGLVVNLP